MDPKMTLAEQITIIILILFFALVAVSFFVGAFYLQAETVYAKIFKRPFYIHYYPFPKRMESSQQLSLRQCSGFYNRLSPKRKAYFEHRVCKFIERYEFVGREDFVITAEVKTRIAASYIALSFGMRNYLVDVFERIIVYPEAYFSSSSDQYHKGEFNPRVKAVVFSWQDFIAGNDISNDNLNLGIHEFAHVLHHHGRNRGDISAAIFAEIYDEILAEVSHQSNRQMLISSGYFREYAYANPFEFLAVILEHYFETPDEFKIRFPKLYSHVSKMLNHKH